jgi:16S rRNA (cytosine967-C5)-methyltransferase
VKNSSLLGHVVELLDFVLAGRRPADAVVREFFRARHYLGSSDRRFIAERTFDVLRHYRLLTLRSRIALGTPGAESVSGSSALPTVVLVAAHEASGAGPDSTELASDIAGIWDASSCGVPCAVFIEALSRAEIPDEIRSDPARMIALQHSMPDFVVEEWIGRFGAEETELLCGASNSNPPVSIRANALKGDVAECVAALAREGIAAGPGTLSRVGLVFPKRINAQGLHAFRQGFFEMQDEGSQILSMLMEARPGMTVLDACAGGGGKSLHLAAIMQNRGRIIALDTDARKLENLVLRGRRAGVTIATTTVVTEEAAAGEAPEADAVLVDAPCSGVGTFRRNPGAKLLCTVDYSLALSRQQRALLERYARSVRSGGRLVYSTCTLLRRENQDVVADFLSRHPEFSLVPAGGVLDRQGIACPGQEDYLELLPHKTGTDGYFAAVMVRGKS